MILRRNMQPVILNNKEYNIYLCPVCNHSFTSFPWRATTKGHIVRVLRPCRP